MKDKIERFGLCLDTENMQFYTPDGGKVVDLPASYKRKVLEIIDGDLDPDEIERELAILEMEAEKDESILNLF